SHQSQEPPRARLQREGQHQHAAGSRHSQPDRSLQPRDRRHRSGTAPAGRRRSREGEAAEPTNRLLELRLRIRRGQARGRSVGVAMSDGLRGVYLARQGETAWTISHQPTGLTDLPLTAGGEVQAARLRGRLEELAFAKVFTSSLKRAVQTCELAG